MRAKWDRPWGESTYGARTIEKACQRDSFIGWDRPVPRGVRGKGGTR